MIERLHIKGYRRFERLSVEGLTRVNLIVGRNNAGKTALLDAIDLYLLRATPEALFRASDRRGEWRSLNTESEGVSGNWLHGGVDLRLLLVGREVHPDAMFSIEEPGRGSLCGRVERVPNGSGFAPALQLQWELGDNARTTVTMQGTRLLWSLHRLRDLSGGTWMGDENVSVRFLRTSADPLAQLSADWNEIALTDREDAVVAALRALEPDIRRIAYLGGGGVYADPEGFVVTLGDAQVRVPLGSLGDGLKRILSIVVNAAAAAGGTLFVDEIDTGLHHAAMRSMWRSLLALARAQNVQVFATTHSIDCVHALGQLVDDGEASAADVSLHRLEPGEHATVRYTGDEIAAVARGAMEVR